MEFELTEAREFTRFDLDFSSLGQPKVFRIYYEIPVSAQAFSRFVLHEGVRFQAFRGAEIRSQSRVTPYDAFAVWLHYRQERLKP